jgi:chemotaxis protein CheC
MGLSQLTEAQLEVLMEISNSGMGRAATALSQLMGKSIQLKVPRIVAMDIARVPEFLGGAQQMVVGIYLQILGDARGNIMMVFPLENALKMLERLLTGSKSKGSLLTELEISALKEVGNIFASAYLNALGEMLKMTLIPSIPVLSFDTAGAVVDYVLKELSEFGDMSIMIETAFSVENDNINGHFFLLPDPPSLTAMLNKMNG